MELANFIEEDMLDFIRNRHDIEVSKKQGKRREAEYPELQLTRDYEEDIRNALKEGDKNKAIVLFNNLKREYGRIPDFMKENKDAVLEIIDKCYKMIKNYKGIENEFPSEKEITVNIFTKGKGFGKIIGEENTGHARHAGPAVNPAGSRQGQGNLGQVPPRAYVPQQPASPMPYSGRKSEGAEFLFEEIGKRLANAEAYLSGGNLEKAELEFLKAREIYNLVKNDYAVEESKVFNAMLTVSNRMKIARLEKKKLEEYSKELEEGVAGFGFGEERVVPYFETRKEEKTDGFSEDKEELKKIARFNELINSLASADRERKLEILERAEAVLENMKGFNEEKKMLMLKLEMLKKNILEQRMNGKEEQGDEGAPVAMEDNLYSKALRIMEQGDYRNAAVLFKEIVDADKNNLSANIRLAECLEKIEGENG